jgi:hypothetical protein
MALIICPECRKQISDTAQSCPNCGYKLTPEKVAELKKTADKINKAVGIGCMGIIVLVFIFFVIGQFTSKPKRVEASVPVKNEAAPKTPQETRKDEIEKHFSVWDGSHNELTAYIKKQMNDPGSYQHVRTQYFDKGDHLVVITEFRGKNAFGALIRNVLAAKVDLKGNILEVIPQQ